jgi:hypothetical protein
MASESSDPNNWTWAAMEPELTEREKALRDVFVNEYLVDYDIIKAAQRCGFQHSFAKDYGIKFWNESYVQKRIELVKHSRVDEKQMEEFDRATVRAVLRKEMQNQFNSGAARVAAAAKMASILGMDKPVETPAEGEHRGGVLMVPAIANMNDWEAVAQASQAKLVADART